MSEYRNLTRNILRIFRQADEEVRALGRTWYDTAYTEVERRAWRHHADITRSVIALAHLSPRTTWSANLQGLDFLLAGAEKPGQILTKSWERAVAAMTEPDPWATFGPSALKTRQFARAICGDPGAIVIDVWALRVAGAPEGWASRRAAHVAVSDAYRRAARIESVPPRDLQATAWIQLRGSAA